MYQKQTMSLATLKKKTAAKYNNSSVNTPAFSLNGIYRSQGYVGQSTSGRSLSRALTTHDGILRGSGSCCGVYKSGPVFQSGIFQNEVIGTVKPSVQSQQEVLNRRKGCFNGMGGEIDEEGQVLYSGSGCNVSKNQKQNHNNSSGDYIEYYRQKNISDVLLKADQPVNIPSSKCSVTCSKVVKENKEIKAAISQGDHLLNIKARCAPSTKQGMFFNNSRGTGIVCSTKGTKGY